MKFLIVFVALFAVAMARPDDHEHAEILKLDSDVQPEHYSFELETSDGTSRHEEGVLKEGKDKDGKDNEHGTLVVHGEYEYKDKHDGEIYSVKYVADEHGFQPEGKHLPRLPKIVV